MKEKVNVTGVPETMVQTLYARKILKYQKCFNMQETDIGLQCLE